MTTVFRLPEEPPVGTTVRPEPDTGERCKRITPACWLEQPNGVAMHSWPDLFVLHPEALTIVEPDPHPTPWTLDEDSDNATGIRDANGVSVCEVYEKNAGATAARIVKAVNEATP